MAALPNYTSFNGVLDSIIRSYLLNELPPEVGESGIRYHNVAERDLGLSQARFLKNLQNPGNPNIPGEPTNNNNEGGQGQGDGQVPGTSASARLQDLQNATNEHEYVKALYQCFEKRGVFKELQTFLRHKLVSILQDEFPDLQQQQQGISKVDENTMVFRLIEDFLKCHRLLYTLSVLVSEGDVKKLNSKELYGKLSAKQAEDLLDELGIKRNSRLSGQILKCYFDQQSFSLLESMHYLGVWVDDSPEHQFGVGAEAKNLPGPNVNRPKKREKPGSGEAIFLSRNPKSEEKVMKDVTVQCGNTTGSAIGVERRMLEMERRLEKEKEAKLKESLERFKSEEETRIREEMEANFQLRLLEREKEHFSDMQRKMEEVNADFQRERQRWLEEKVKHEKQLTEFQKKLADMAKQGLADRNLASETPRVPHPSSEVHYCSMRHGHDDMHLRCPYDCDCGRKHCRQHGSKRGGKSGHHLGESLNNTPRHKLPSEAIQEDQLVFLQYRLEQQDEEIKNLRRQLHHSPRVLVVQKGKSAGVGGGDAPRKESGQNDEGDEEEEDHSEKTNDDLGSFLRNAKTRVGKLDLAVSKVDEIVQEVLAKRRETTPVSTLLSARMQATAEQRRLKRSRFTTSSSLHSEIPPVHIMAPPSALVHQQLPEKQIKFVTPELQMCSSNHNNDVYGYYKETNSGRNNVTEIGAGAASMSPRSPYHHQSTDVVIQAPSTPRERMFPVAYGPQSTIPKVKSPPKKLDFGDSEPQTLYKVVDDSSKVSQVPIISEEDENVEESLFHKAAKHLLDSERSSGGSSSKENSISLEEKAIKHGALSKEKVESPDEYEDGDCRSVSIAESISIGLGQAKRVLKTVNGNNTTSHKKNGSLEKPKGSGNIPQDKVSSSSDRSSRGYGRQSKSKSKAKSGSNDNSQVPVSSSSYVIQKTRQTNGGATNDLSVSDPNDNDLSNISAPKSEDIEDFWQI